MPESVFYWLITSNKEKPIMPEYEVFLSGRAKKQLDKLSFTIAQPILEAIKDLGNNPRPQGYIKLKGRDGFRIRAGNYRIIYEIFDTDLIVDVVTLGHRKDIYE